MFITQTREKILRLFFEKPELRIHQRGIVRRARVNPQNAHKYLREFVQHGLLLRSESPLFVLYRLNPNNAYLFKMFELFELMKKEDFYADNKILARRLLKYTQILRRLSDDEIRTIILFGPAARKEWTEGSEVDILTVSHAKAAPKKLSQIHEAAAHGVRHMLRISSRNLASDEVIQGFRKKRGFFSDLWRDRIVLYNEFSFWEMIRN
jgi:predicted nucleotidyltransferase